MLVPQDNIQPIILNWLLDNKMLAFLYSLDTLFINITTAKNFQAIEEWVREYRPDLVQYLPMCQKQDSMILLLTVGFEAGRQFQKKNPKLPLNDPSVYLS